MTPLLENRATLGTGAPLYDLCSKGLKMALISKDDRDLMWPSGLKDEGCPPWWATLVAATVHDATPPLPWR